MADESFDMQAEYEREAMSGLRTLFDFAGIPTQADEISFYTQNIPAGSLIEGLTGGGFSAGLSAVGEAEPIDIEATLTEYGVSPEMAGLGALAAGAMKGRGRGLFEDLASAINPKAAEDALDKTLREADDAWKNRSFSDMDIERKLKLNEEVDVISRQGLMDTLSKLNKELVTENLTPATRASHEAKIKRLRAQIGNEPEAFAKGGRPGTRRRKKIMVPSSYKAGGQVFQKGYYGKTYK